MQTELFLLDGIKPVLTKDQQTKLDSLIAEGHTFCSLFHDGCISLAAPDHFPVYIERDGSAVKYMNGQNVAI